jgi:membrane protein
MWQFLKEIIREWQQDNISQLAAALSYFAVVSLAPLLVLVVVIVGLFYGREAARAELMMQVEGVVGPEVAQFVETVLVNASQPELASIAGILSFLILLWGSTNLFSQLQFALNTIWDVDSDAEAGIWATVKKRFWAFAMVIGIAVLLLANLILSSVLTTLSGTTAVWLPQVDWLWPLINFIVSLVVITVLIAAIFKILPEAEIAWRHVWLGAAVTAVLFIIGQFALSFYLSNAGSAYGAAGSFAVFLIWVYYSARSIPGDKPAYHFRQPRYKCNNIAQRAIENPVDPREPVTAVRV